MIVYPKFLTDYSLGLIAGSTDFFQLSIEIYYDLNINTETQNTIENIRMSCHKDAISVSCTNDYVELCVNGTKFISLTGEYFVFDGVSLIPLNAENLGLVWINKI